MNEYLDTYCSSFLKFSEEKYKQDKKTVLTFLLHLPEFKEEKYQEYIMKIFKTDFNDLVIRLYEMSKEWEMEYNLIIRPLVSLVWVCLYPHFLLSTKDKRNNDLMNDTLGLIGWNTGYNYKYLYGYKINNDVEKITEEILIQTWEKLREQIRKGRCSWLCAFNFYLLNK